MSRVVSSIMLICVSIGAQGCAQLYDTIDSRIIECRSKGVARKAWKSHADYWQNEIHEKDFSKGFQAGYFAVMQGKGTRPPTLPPRMYWSAWNMKEDCHQRTLAWFNGYHAGASVAVGDGVENLCRIVTADEIYRKDKNWANGQRTDSVSGDFLGNSGPHFVPPPLPADEKFSELPTTIDSQGNSTAPRTKYNPSPEQLLLNK